MLNATTLLDLTVALATMDLLAMVHHVKILMIVQMIHVKTVVHVQMGSTYLHVSVLQNIMEILVQRKTLYVHQIPVILELVPQMDNHTLVNVLPSSLDKIVKQKLVAKHLAHCLLQRELVVLMTIVFVVVNVILVITTVQAMESV